MFLGEILNGGCRRRFGRGLWKRRLRRRWWIGRIGRIFLEGGKSLEGKGNYVGRDDNLVDNSVDNLVDSLVGVLMELLGLIWQ